MRDFREILDGRALKALRLFGKWFWRVCTHNFWLKLLSVVFALFLWSYVITSSPSITREKTLTGIDITVSGQSVLSSRGLAILTDTETLAEARVRVRVAQSNYAQASADNVHLELDLSGIRTAGKQSVRLRGTTTYGTILEIWPQYVDLQIENQDQRYVPVNAKLTGDQRDDYWYSVIRTNPTQITVSGPASVVETVSSAEVRLDVTGRTASHNRVEQVHLLDAQGQEIVSSLSKSSSSIAVALDIYPVKSLPVTTDPQELLTGAPPVGFHVGEITVTPATIRVAADDALLDSLDTLSVAPVDVSGATTSFTSVTRITHLKNVKNLSSEEVQIFVGIEEDTLTQRVSNVQISLAHLPEDKSVACSLTHTNVLVTGRYSAVNALTRTDLSASVDLTGLEDGTYTLPIAVSANTDADLVCAAEPEMITVEIAPRE